MRRYSGSTLGARDRSASSSDEGPARAKHSTCMGHACADVLRTELPHPDRYAATSACQLWQCATAQEPGRLASATAYNAGLAWYGEA